MRKPNKVAIVRYDTKSSQWHLPKIGSTARTACASKDTSVGNPVAVKLITEPNVSKIEHLCSGCKRCILMRFRKLKEKNG